MFDDGRLVGHYAVIPMRLWVGGSPCRAALSMTTMTHPDYHRRGIFTALATEVYEECLEKGIEVVYGFPNRNSYHGFVYKLGWTGLGQVSYLEVEVGRLGPCRRKGLWMERIESFDSAAEPLWETLRGMCPVVHQRDASFLNWRYFQNPIEHYDAYYAKDEVDVVRGWLVVKEYQGAAARVAEIVDLLGADRDALEFMIAWAGENYSSRASKMAVWSSLTQGERETLLGMGFKEKKWVGFDSRERPTFFGFKALKDQDHLTGIMGRMENWRLTMGDSDVF